MEIEADILNGKMCYDNYLSSEMQLIEYSWYVIGQ